MAAEPPLIKVCGITRPQDAVACSALDVWAIGLVFADSPRQVDAETAAEITGVLDPMSSKVGVFVEPDPAEVAEIASRARLTHIQIHGGDVAAIKEATPLPVVEAFRVAGADDLDAARASAADLVLLDAAVPGQHGGTGTSFDWSLLEGAPLGRPWILAGGLTPENVVDAVARLSPDVVDVSSGVESEPGLKDPERIRAFSRGAMLGWERGNQA